VQFGRIDGGAELFSQPVCGCGGSRRIEIFEPEIRSIESNENDVELGCFLDGLHRDESFDLESRIPLVCGPRQPLCFVPMTQNQPQLGKQFEISAAFTQRSIANVFRHRVRYRAKDAPTGERSRFDSKRADHVRDPQTDFSAGNDRSEKFAVQEPLLLGGEFVEQFVEFLIAHKNSRASLKSRNKNPLAEIPDCHPEVCMLSLSVAADFSVTRYAFQTQF
jgi:hypothetical protein